MNQNFYLEKDYSKNPSSFKVSIVISVCALIVSIIFPPLGFILFPGFLFLFIFSNDLGNDFLLRIIFIIAFSFAYWVISFWLLYIPIWTYWIWLTIIISGLLAIVLSLIKRSSLWTKQLDRLESVDSKQSISRLSIFFIFGIISALRFIPAFIQLVPCGQDMSMHTYNTSLILLWQQIPGSYQPIFNMEGFGAQGAGFSVLSAILSTLGKIPTYRATFLMAALSHVLIIGGFYVFLRCHFTSLISLLTAVFVAILARDPQQCFQWGGNPTALAFFFLMVAYWLFYQEINKKSISVSNIFLISFLISAGFLTHFIPALVFSLILLFLAGFKIIFNISLIRSYAIKLFTTIVFCAILILPYGIVFQKVKVSETEWQTIINWSAKHWTVVKELILQPIINRLPFLLEKNPVPLLPWAMILMVLGFPIFVLSLMGFLVNFKKQKALIIESLLIFIVPLFLLYLNVIKPTHFSTIFYPDRIAIFFTLPAAILIAGMFKLFTRFKLFWWIILIYGIVLTSSITIWKKEGKDFSREKVRSESPIRLVANEFLGRNFYHYLFNRQYFAVTQGDLKAFEWLADNIPKNEPILINYDDAGVWIPAILSRPAYLSHIVFTLSDEYKSSFKDFQFKYLYVGEKPVGPDIPFTKEYCNSKPESFEVLYQNGSAIYRIKKPVQ